MRIAHLCRLAIFGAASSLIGCGSAVAEDAGLDASRVDGGLTDGGVVDAELADGDAGSTDASVDAFIPPPPCTWDDLRAPEDPTVFWPATLNATGADTLGGHGHDDGRGPIGFCRGTPVAGQPFYRLLAVGFETDDDANGDGDVNDPLPVDFWRRPDTETGIGESAGRINVYIEVVDEAGVVLNRFSAPEINFVREIHDGPVESFPLTDKPANEFQTNFPMVGGGAAFGAQIEGASDRVLNMRLPNNHHVTFALVFQRVG